MKRIILALVITLMAATFAAADTIYLRDGRTVRGTVLGFVQGRFVVRVDYLNNDIIFLRPNQIDRIEIEGRSIDEARFVNRTVDVELGQNWVDTGVDLRQGERVRVNASGVIYAGRMRITPNGTGRTDPNAPLPRASEGVLIGVVGNDPNAPIIEIGANREFVADRAGRLYLTINRAGYSDARGSYRAEIRREIDLNAVLGRGNGNGAYNRNDTYNRNDENINDNDPFGVNGSNQPAPVRPRLPNDSAVGSSVGYGRTNETTINVPGNSRGTDTGIDLRSGDQVAISATGSIVAGRRAGEVTPDGGRAGAGAIFGTYPVPNAGVGALIGYIRLTNGQASQPFLIGSNQTFTTPVDGRLILLVNDDNYSDNSGQFTVRITFPQYNRY
ncbi:MAG: hypothetical protein AUG51_02615 [Acidobacteria bacterium 13_1_20CM_3_53_8]|nr:MAG: hypothetical protein AUG51_02615 [Acidobacteria bacterium 13_1_20CM_3_53_8]